MPHGGAKPCQHDSANRCAARPVIRDGARHQCGKGRVAGAMVGHQWYVADLHDKVGRKGFEQLVRLRQRRRTAALIRMLQAERYAVGAVGVNDAARGGVKAGGGCVNVGMQGHGFAGPVTTELQRVGVQPGEPGRVKKAQAGIGRGDEKAAAGCALQAHADVAGRRVHVAAVEQAFPDTAYRFTGLGLRHTSIVKAWVKKSSAPKLPDLSVR